MVGTRVAPEKKIRLDQTIKDTELIKQIDNQVFANVCADYCCREQWKVGIYIGDSGGFYSAHRDNWVDKTHRQKSIVISLSHPSDYEGGDLFLEEVGREFKLEFN